MSQGQILVVRACLQAYLDKDRSAIEALLDEKYHFTSPIDNRLDREAYLRICWPNSQYFAEFEPIFEAERGAHAFIAL